MQIESVQEALAEAEALLKDTGRVLLRASGTEPVVRVMVEGQDAQQVLQYVSNLQKRSSQL